MRELIFCNLNEITWDEYIYFCSLNNFTPDYDIYLIWSKHEHLIQLKNSLDTLFNCKISNKDFKICFSNKEEKINSIKSVYDKLVNDSVNDSVKIFLDTENNYLIFNINGIEYNVYKINKNNTIGKIKYNDIIFI